MGQPTTSPASAQELMGQRELVQTELNKFEQILIANKNVGMDGPLVDNEGFPRSDIDVLAVRQARVRIIELMNDFKFLTNEIGRALEHVFQPSSSSSDTQQQPTVTRTTTSIKKPIALVDGVHPGSPADTAGLKRGDVILKFGQVMGGGGELLASVNGEVLKNVGKEVGVIVSRGDQEVNLVLVPSQWSGRGLLGCHIVPHA